MDQHPHKLPAFARMPAVAPLMRRDVCRSRRDGSSFSAAAVPTSRHPHRDNDTFSEEAEEDESTASQPHLRNIESPASLPFCAVSFTGFREDDESHLLDCVDDGGGVAKRDGRDRQTELEVYEDLVSSLPHINVQQTLTASTDVLVARRGFTKKRLLATLRHIPVVRPVWIENGCPRRLLNAISAAQQPDGLHEGGPTELRNTTRLAIDASFAVPWLHGYVFTTTGLTTHERSAIDDICTRQHGAVLEASLTYRCDVLLTSGECVLQLQRWRRLAVENWNANEEDESRGGKMRRQSQQLLPRGRTMETEPGNEADAANHVDQTDAWAADNWDSWLTDKVRFALEFDIPVVDYVKFLSLLRLNRLPAPGLDLAAGHSTNNAAAPAPWSRATDDALSAGDFDAVVDVCRVPPPRGGASRWSLLFARLTRRQSGGVEDAPAETDENCREGEENDSKEMARRARQNSSASVSHRSTASSSSSASTVSDPDAWDDFVNHLLLPQFPSENTELSPAAQRIEAYPPRKEAVAAAGRETAPSPQQCTTRLTLNTADVEVLPLCTNAGTMAVSQPDYYADTHTSSLAQADALTMRDTAGSFPAPFTADALTLGMIAVEPSPRLSTNALMHRDVAPRAAHEKLKDEGDATRKKESQGDNLAACSAASYEAQQQEHPSQRCVSTSENDVGTLRARTPAPRHVSTLSSNRESATLCTITKNTGSWKPDAPAEDRAAISQHNGNATLLTNTQVLVESCTNREESGAGTSMKHAARVGRGEEANEEVPQPQQRRDGAPGNTLATRTTLPLSAMHPPYLTVSCLGATEAEQLRVRRCCAVCRFRCTPFPTCQTDVVVLGSHVLSRKKRTVSALQQHCGTRELKRSGGVGGLRAVAASTASHPGTKAHTVGSTKLQRERHKTVTLRYWEMDATVARVLTELCGISLDCLAPLRWLEDAAEAAGEAAAAALEKSMLHVAEEPARANATWPMRRTDDPTAFTAVKETATALPDTLAELAHEHLEAALPSTTTAEVGFYPFPVLSEEQLPPLCSPPYYIRLRRPLAATLPTSRTSRTEAAALEVAREAAASDLPISGRRIEDGASAALKAGGTIDGALRTVNASGTIMSRSTVDVSAMSSASMVSLPSNASTATTQHTRVSSSNDHHRDDYNRDHRHHHSRASRPLSADGAASTQTDSSARATPQPQPLHLQAPFEDSARTTEQQAHQADLATAGRCFQQLLALFQVDGNDTVHAAVLEATSGTSDAASGKSWPGTSIDRVDRRHVFQSCTFCVTDCAFSRVDWAVLRGLVRYGGGHVEKRRAADWQALLTGRRQEKGEALAQRPPSTRSGSSATEARKPSVVKADDGDAGLSVQDRRLALVLRRHIEYDKQKLKLARLRLAEVSRQPSSLVAPDTYDRNDENPRSKGRSDNGGDEQETTRCVDASRVTRLTAKLTNTIANCQLASALCVVPHSFQRPPALLAHAQRENAKASTEAPAAPRSSTSRAAPSGLQRLPTITMDYVLASLAVGFCLHPHRCFLFHLSIPSAPDLRLFHHPPQSRLTGEATRSQGGHTNAAASSSSLLSHDAHEKGTAMSPLPQRPMLSSWMRERRYSKPDSVGVCVSVLWQLPSSNTERWVQSVDAAEAKKASYTPRMHLTPGSAAAQDAMRSLRVDVPSARLIPLLRVLLLGLRNAIEAMGGHVVDGFSSTAVTHVVVVDLEYILTSTLQDMFNTSSTMSGDEEENEAKEGAAWHARSSSSELSPPTKEAYSPAEDVASIIRGAAQDEVSLVPMQWLAQCVEWGAFIDESVFSVPATLQRRVEDERRNVQRTARNAKSAQQQQQRQQRGSEKARGAAPAVVLPTARLSAQSIRDGSAARAAEERQREGTPPPHVSAVHGQDSDIKLMRHRSRDVATRTARGTAATLTPPPPHTPPRPSLAPPAQRQQPYESPRLSQTQETLVPTLTAYPTDVRRCPDSGTADVHQQPKNEVDGGGVESTACAAHTPVMRRLLPTSASNSNSGLEAVTPPPRPPLPFPPHAQLQRQQKQRQPVPSRESLPWPSPALSALPSHPYVQRYHEDRASQSNSNTVPLRAASGSNSNRSAAVPRRHRSLPSVSQQHNTRSSAEQEDAEAYVEHLGGMFNFNTPGSTPVPSSARGDRQRSTAAYREKEERRTPRQTYSSPPQLLQHMLNPSTGTGASQTSPHKNHQPASAMDGVPRRITDGERTLELLSSPTTTQPLPTSQSSGKEAARETQLSAVLQSTPRRRTLRDVAAAAAGPASVHASATRTPLGSPERRRRRTEETPPSLSLHAPSQRFHTPPLSACHTGDVLAGTTAADVLASQAAQQLSSSSLTRADAQISQRQQQQLEQRVLGGSAILSRNGTVTRDATRAVVPASDTLVEGETQVLPDDVARETARQAAEEPRGEPWIAETLSPSDNVPETNVTASQHQVLMANATSAKDGVRQHRDESQQHFFTSTMEEVIPDSQPDVQDNVDEQQNNVLASASLIAATQNFYEPPPRTQGHEEEDNAVAKIRVADQRRDFDGAGKHINNREADTPGDRSPGMTAAEHRSAGPTHATAAFAPSPATSASSSQTSTHLPQLGTGTALRQASPSPCPRSPVPQGTLDVDVDEERTASGRAPQAVPTHGTSRADGGKSRIAATTATAGSPWLAHRPLSLSRRPSRSPVPSDRQAVQAIRQQSVSKAPRECKSVRAAASFLHAELGLWCLRVYVLHDVPQRAGRVQGCQEALETFQQKQLVDGPRHPGTIAAPFAPPFCFVSCCEDADVCVTHVVNLRESVLVALAAKCCLVQPGFLECITAIVRGFQGDGNVGSGGEAWRGAEPGDSHGGTSMLHLLPHPSHASALSLPRRLSSAESASRACYALLCERLSTYQWRFNAATDRALAPMQRSLLMQCEEQQKHAEAGKLTRLLCRNQTGPRATQPQQPRLFDLYTVVQLFTAPAQTLSRDTNNTNAERRCVARTKAVEHILIAGGAHVARTIQLGSSALDAKTSGAALHSGNTRPPWRCCAAFYGSSARPSPSSREVTDVDLYHDLLWLLCEALHESCGATAAGLHGHSRKHAGKLLVLFDASLLTTPEVVGGDDSVCEDCCVVRTATRDARAPLEQQQQPNATCPGRVASDAATAATPRMTVGEWLLRWLCVDLNAVEERGSCPTTDATFPALRAHLMACLSLVHHMAAMEETGTSAAAKLAPPASGKASSMPALIAFAQSKWRYTMADIPFAVPSMEEICVAFGTREDKRLKTPSQTLKRSTEVPQYAAQHIEIRRTSWLGACVAAGGPDVLADAAKVAEHGVPYVEAAARQTRETWLRDADAQTLLGALPYL